MRPADPQQMSSGSSIRRWSTSSIPAAARFDFWLFTLREALWPVSEWRDVAPDFRVDMREASLGCVTSVAQVITPHRSHRTREDVNRSAEDSYHLFFSDGPSLAVMQGGRTETVRAGEAILVGSQEHETFVPEGFSGIILKFPADWVRSWVDNPKLIVGRTITRDSRWGRVICPMVSQLTPEFVSAPPLPAGVLVDHLGVVFAMMAGASDQRAMPEVARKIQELIQARHIQPTLTPVEVAGALNVPLRILHRALQAKGTTFLRLLTETRLDTALALLRSPALRDLTVTQIALRAGFANMAHFSRVVRKRTGRSPQDLRIDLS